MRLSSKYQEKTLSQKSDLSMSSAKKNIEFDNESNSIITEEESAFEDFSPRNRNKLEVGIEVMDKPPRKEEPTKMQKLKGNQNIAGNTTYRDTEKLEVNNVSKENGK